MNNDCVKKQIPAIRRGIPPQSQNSPRFLPSILDARKKQEKPAKRPSSIASKEIIVARDFSAIALLSSVCLIGKNQPKVKIARRYKGINWL